MKRMDGEWNYDVFQLDCDRVVTLEECYISISDIGRIEGGKEAIRPEVLRMLPDRIKKKFPGSYYGILIKSPADNTLPAYVFMVSLICNQSVGKNPDEYLSGLVVCWFQESIDTALSDSIANEIHSVEWDKYAVDFGL